MKFKIILSPDTEDGGYNVSCPALPGCHSQGDTIEEATANIQEAIEGCLEVLNERTKPSTEELSIVSPELERFKGV